MTAVGATSHARLFDNVQILRRVISRDVLVFCRRIFEQQCQLFDALQTRIRRCRLSAPAAYFSPNPTVSPSEHWFDNTYAEQRWFKVPKIIFGLTEPKYQINDL
jgi:hypothetical protein